MPFANPEPLRYPGSAPTTGGTPAMPGASTDAATAWMQQQPWYRSTLASWGNPSVLTLGQRGYLARTAIQAGMDPSFGISTDGTVEDWSTPTGSKIALAAFGAAAGASAAGAFGGGSAAASGSAPAAGGAGAATKIATGVATNAASNAVNTAMGTQGSGSKTAEVMALLGGLLSGKLIANHGASANVPPQLSQLLDLGTQRAQAQQPTFNAVNQGIFKMLPTSATQGIAPPTPMTVTPSPQASQTSDSGGMNPWLAGGLGAAGGIGLGGLLTGTNPYGAIVDGLKKIFGNNGGGSSTSAIDPSTWKTVGPPDPNDPSLGDWSQS